MNLFDNAANNTAIKIIFCNTIHNGFLVKLFAVRVL